MNRWLLAALCMALAAQAGADSFRCGGKLVRAGDSSNALLKRCGKPVRKYAARAVAPERGGQQEVSVSNWVYERRGKRDMIASVRHGKVVRIRVDRD
jgi:hypothetical protein